jgi:hypothetical protein
MEMIRKQLLKLRNEDRKGLNKKNKKQQAITLNLELAQPNPKKEQKKEKRSNSRPAIQK